MKKAKLLQPQTHETRQERDDFQTPPYATRILLPFLEVLRTPENPFPSIWECAAGEGRLARVLHEAKFIVHTTDICHVEPFEFLTGSPDFRFDAIVTNPPFSIKEKFFWKCIEYGKPFALLVPGDESRWTWKARFELGCQKIVPDDRICFLTPNILDNICRGETFIRLPKAERDRYEGKPGKLPPELWDRRWLYPSIDECPKNLLVKWSKAQFHSVWLTRGLGLKGTETGVKVTKEMKLEGVR